MFTLDNSESVFYARNTGEDIKNLENKFTLTSSSSNL